MKRKKLVAFLAAAALLVGSALPAYGAAHYNTWNWNLRQAYSGASLSSPWATYDYDYGTSLPNDDVSAQSHLSLGSDMTGFAYVKIWGESGRSKVGSSTKFVSGYVHSGWVTVAGDDYAEEINYIVRRYIGSAMTEYNDTVY